MSKLRKEYFLVKLFLDKTSRKSPKKWSWYLLYLLRYGKKTGGEMKKSPRSNRANKEVISQKFHFDKLD